MRLRLAFALTALPIAIGSYLVACQSEQEIEDLCGWLGDPNNCYRALSQDIGAQCGVTVDPATTPPADPNNPSPRHGTFLKRDKLDLCVLDATGQVIFDPPLDITQFPVTTASFASSNRFSYKARRRRRSTIFALSETR